MPHQAPTAAAGPAGKFTKRRYGKVGRAERKVLETFDWATPGRGLPGSLHPHASESVRCVAIDERDDHVGLPVRGFVFPALQVGPFSAGRFVGLSGKQPQRGGTRDSPFLSMKSLLLSHNSRGSSFSPFHLMSRRARANVLLASDIAK
jgi:hypothetical protein